MPHIGLKGENLIFLISQPRAGSTLLQRMLGSHPEIHTVSEPWLMLHPLYAMRHEGYETEYNAHAAWGAMQAFLQSFPEGEKEFIEGIRRMYSHLYTKALETSGKRYFLDKTPRYYFVIPELYRVFPKAHYIILFRNPLAVLASVLSTWIRDLFSLYGSKYDLVQAPRLLLEGKEVVGKQGVVVHYEHLVKDPEDQMQRICGKLEIDFMPEMIEYGRRNNPHWHFGDQKEVYQHSRPVSQNAEKWVRAIDDPQTWRLARDYLRLLGRETVAQMGYSYEQLWNILGEHRPSRIRLWFTVPMAWLLRKPVKEYGILMGGTLWVVGSLLRQGIRGTMDAAKQKLAQRLYGSK